MTILKHGGRCKRVLGLSLIRDSLWKIWNGVWRRGGRRKFQILPWGEGTDWGAWVIILPAAGSLWGIGEALNFAGTFPAAGSLWGAGWAICLLGLLAVFALIAYRLFWNQFQTYDNTSKLWKHFQLIIRNYGAKTDKPLTCFIWTTNFPDLSAEELHGSRNITIQASWTYKSKFGTLTTYLNFSARSTRTSRAGIVILWACNIASISATCKIWQINKVFN